MATDLREVLSRYVPQAILDEAIEEVKGTEVAPEWWRSEMSKVTPDAKRARELEAELDSIKTAPKRKEAFKQVGVQDYDALPRSVQKTFDAVPADKLGDLNFLAQMVVEEGIEVDMAGQQQPRERSGAEQITDFLTSAGQGAPLRTSQQAKDAEFEAEMNKARNAEEGVEVLRKYGRLAANFDG